MSTASNHSPTELKAGNEGRGLSASVMDELRVLKDRRRGQMEDFTGVKMCSVALLGSR